MIQNIIFDFGGVIYDIDHERTKKAFDLLGIKNFEQLYSHAIQTHLFEEFEKGQISPAEFRNTLHNHLPKNITNEQIDKAWNALLLGFRKDRIRLLQKISAHYTLFLLSNTNQIHYQHYMQELETIGLKVAFLNAFDHLYFSHQVGLRKPDPLIFQLVLDNHELRANNTLFIDDYDVNIEAAKNQGLQTFLLKPTLTLSSVFTEEGLLAI